MAFDFEVRLAFSHSDTVSNDGQAGIIALSDGSYVFGFGVQDGGDRSRWYRSTDQGENWSHMGDAARMIIDFPHRCTNRPTGELFYPQTGQNLDTVNIYKSTNGAASFTSTFSITVAAPPPGRLIIATGATLVQRDRVIITGAFEPAHGQPRLMFLRSDDGGANWTAYGAIGDNHNFSFGTAITNAGEGNIIAALRMLPAFTYWPRVFLSADHGITWSQSNALPLPSGCNFININAISAVTPDIICMSATGNESPAAHNSYVWRSTDAGVSWSRISEGSIDHWSEMNRGFEGLEVHRVTRDCVLLSVDNDENHSYFPMRVSLDQGASYPLTPTIVSGSMSPLSTVTGAIVTAKNGNILIPVYRQPGGNVYHEVWIGNVIC